MSTAQSRGPKRSPLGAKFWRLWWSSSASNLADGVVKIALPLVAIGYTQSPLLVAGLGVAITLPWLLFALPAGALADRLDRRRFMLGANLARIALLALLVLSIAVDAGSIWLLYVIAFGLGIAETCYDTSAQSILPQVVSPDRLSRANGRLFAAELTANSFVGPPLGGVLVTLGAAAAFVAPAALWIVAAGVLLLLRGSFRIPRETRTTLRADIAEGLRFLVGHRVLRTLAIMTGISNLATNAAFAIFVLYAVGTTSAMGLTEPEFGLLLTATAVGSLVGAFAAERVEQLLGRSKSLAITIVGSTVLVGAPAFTADPFLIGAAFFVGGFTIVVWNVIVVSLRQRVAPPGLLGRVNSGYRLVAWGTMPIGAALGGVLGEFFGLTVVFAVMGVLVLSQAVFLRSLTDAAIDASERDAG